MQKQQRKPALDVMRGGGARGGDWRWESSLQFFQIKKEPAALAGGEAGS